LAYIGKTPTIGNFQVCDAISVVNGQAAYTMQVGSVNVSPESANHMLVSLNGILQKPGSSFTVSGSTITFASNLVTGDVIDFIQILGNVLDLGVPSDATVSTAKIVDANVTLAKLSATGTKDATTFLRGDNTFAEAGGGAFEKISTTTISSSVANVDFDTLSTDYEDFRIIISNLNIDTNQQYITLRVKRSGQGSFDSGSSDYLTSGIGRDAVGNTITTNSTGLSYIRISNDNVNGTLAWSPFNATVDIYNPHSTVTKCFAHCLASMSNGTYAHITTTIAGGYRNSTDAVIGLQIGVTSGNLDGGKLTLYGRKI